MWHSLDVCVYVAHNISARSSVSILAVTFSYNIILISCTVYPPLVYFGVRHWKPYPLSGDLMRIMMIFDDTRIHSIIHTTCQKCFSPIHTYIFFSAAFYFYSLCVHLLFLILRWVRGSEHERYQVMMYALEALHTVRDVRLRGCLLWRAASNPNCMYSICIIFVLSIKLWECASGEMTQSIYVHFVYSCIFCGGDSRVWE